MATKLEGNHTHIPISIPTAAICAILVIFMKEVISTQQQVLMMTNHHPPECPLRLDFYPQSIDCRPGRWVAGTRGVEERVGPFHPLMVDDRRQKMDEGRRASSLPPTSSVSAKDKVENLCQRHKNFLWQQKLHADCIRPQQQMVQHNFEIQQSTNWMMTNDKQC
jgi:hypothetical protein